MVCGAMERMCVAGGICFRSVRRRLVGRSGRAEDVGGAASERSEMDER